MDDLTLMQEYKLDISEIDISLLCRICGNPSDDPLVSIYENEFVEDIASKIMIYLPIKVCPDDILPIKICVECVNGVLAWHNLYQCCIDANKKFHAILAEEKLCDENIIPQEDRESCLDNRPFSLDEQNVFGVTHSNSDSNEASTDGLEDKMAVSSIYKDEVEVNDSSQYEVDIYTVPNSDVEVKGDSAQRDICHHLDVVCQYCNIEMQNNEENINLHIVTSANMECEVFCKDCGINVARAMLEHTCQMCDKRFLNKTSLRKHILKHDKIICYICKKVFKKYSNLVAHKKLHVGLLPHFNCPICGWNMNRKYNLMVHITSHIADHPCKICCASFNSELMLRHHLTLMHSKDEIRNYGVTEGEVNCEKCDNSYDSRYKLYMHILTEHNKDKEKFVCQCGMIFEKDIMLKAHEKTHSEALYKCNICTKRFKNLRGLEEHQNTHLDSRPFKCDECDKQFRYSSNLSQHKSMHRGIRNFKCIHCDKKFLRSNTLSMHLKTHENIRDYTCEFCNTSFVQSSSLMKHKKTIHRFCEQCGEMVGDRKQWQIHMWKKCNSSKVGNRDS